MNNIQAEFKDGFHSLFKKSYCQIAAIEEEEKTKLKSIVGPFF